jgi:hypothetical protein
MKEQSVWITITGKIFIPQDEIDLLLEAGHDEYHDIAVSASVTPPATLAYLSVGKATGHPLPG